VSYSKRPLGTGGEDWNRLNRGKEWYNMDGEEKGGGGTNGGIFFYKVTECVRVGASRSGTAGGGGELLLGGT